MEIKNCTRHSPNFGAIYVANKQINFNNIKTSIDIYNLQPQDKSFIDNLKKTINLRDLMPDMDSCYLDNWQTILNIALKKVNTGKMTSYLSLNNNKPCGLINYQKEGNKLFLDTICTFPTEKEKRVPFAGKVLMQTLFEDCMKNGFGTIDLNALTNGPFNAVSKYLSLGFKIIGGEDSIHVMRARKPKIEESLNKLAEMIKTTTHNEEKNLFEITNTKKP